MSDEPILRGWKEIAQACEVSVDTAQRASKRNRDPLPVDYDAFHRPWIYRAALAAWLRRNNMAAPVYHALVKAGLHPSQEPARAAPKPVAKATVTPIVRRRAAG
jgi:hypothetical protein